MKTFTIPIKLESLANKREHWAKKAKRAKEQRQAAYLLCPPVEYFTCVVSITRIAPRELDTDNLAISAKHVRDGIADRLGIDDRDKRVTWAYSQSKGEPKQYAVSVSIVPC